LSAFLLSGEGLLFIAMKLPKKTLNEKMKRQHGRCYYCGTDLIKFEIDHILPFSKYRNGKNENLCLTCIECNRMKGDKELTEFKDILLGLFPYKLIRGMFYFEFIRI